MTTRELVARRTVDWLTRLVGVLGRHKRVAAPAGVVKVNLGSGLAVAPGWINVDGSLNALFGGLPAAVHPFAYRLSGASQYYSQADYCRVLREHRWIHHNLEFGIPLPDQSADFVYSSHFLEHLEEQHGSRLIAESFRVLKPGGVTRIAVPDLEYAFAMYGRGDAESVLRSYFFLEARLGRLARHKFMYDFEMLRRRLEACGFGEVTRCERAVGRTPDLDVLDSRSQDTLFVEATKPLKHGQ